VLLASSLQCSAKKAGPLQVLRGEGAGDSAGAARLPGLSLLHLLQPL
jgi:hypothetical protein